MTPDQLIAAFDVLAEAPNGIQRLRELVLQLAVRGKLVPQDPSDEPASVLLERIREQRLIPEPRGIEPVHRATAPWDIPDSWQWVRLAQLSGFSIGKTPPTKDQSYWTTGAGTPWVSIADMVHNGEVYETSRCVAPKATSDVFRSPPVRRGTLLMSFKLTIGKVSRLGVDAYHNEAIISFSPPYAEVDGWLFMSLPLFAAGGDFNAAIKGKTLNKSSLANLLITVPPLDEQRRIVARVDELMALLDRLEAARNAREATRAAARDSALAALREAETPEDVELAWQRIAERMDDLFTDPADVAPLRQAVLELAVRGRLVPQDPNDEPASALLDRIAEEKTRLTREQRIRRRSNPQPIARSEQPYNLPEGWEWRRFGHVLLDIEAGWSPSALARPKEGSEWGVLKVSSCSWGKFLPAENKALAAGTPPRTEHEVHPGDLLISRANTSELVARSVVVDECPPRLMLSDKTLRLHLGSGAVARYFNFANLSATVRAHYRDQASGTSASMQNIPQTAIWDAPIPVPPAAAQHRIVAKVEDLMGLLDRLEQRLAAKVAAHDAFAAAAAHHLETEGSPAPAASQPAPKTQRTPGRRPPRSVSSADSVPPSP